MNPDIRFEYVDPRPGDVFETLAKMKNFKEIGWMPFVKLKEGIQDCFKEFKK